jgi:hypothetical protein
MQCYTHNDVIVVETACLPDVPSFGHISHILMCCCFPTAECCCDILHADAAAPSPLEAEAYLVRMFSAVARQLPETDEWDLSSLLADGQPVSRATAVAWLNAAYQHAYETEFEQQEDSPTGAVEGLYWLLAFADAVESTRPLLKACCAGLQQLQLYEQLGQQLVTLQTNGPGFGFTSDRQLFLQPNITDFNSLMVGPSAANGAEQEAFIQQVAAQTEQLLWLAYRLELEPLVQRLHGFVRPLCWFSDSLLFHSLVAVFTLRVVEAAGCVVASLPGGK